MMILLFWLSFYYHNFIMILSKTQSPTAALKNGKKITVYEKGMFRY